MDDRSNIRKHNVHIFHGQNDYTSDMGKFDVSISYDQL